MTSRPDSAVRLEAGDHAVTIDVTSGARATSWRVGDLELLGGAGWRPVEHGMYPMAPWAGRLRENAVRWHGGRHVLPATYEGWALHGTCLGQAARVVGQDDRSVTARFDDHPGWPWGASVVVTWQVTEADLLTTVSVHAEEQPFPAVVGWHPWFRRRLARGEPLQWELEASEQLIRGGDHLPTGDRRAYDPSAGPFDDAFVVPSGRARLTWPGALAVDVDSDGCWYVVYDERPEVVCVEPQSGPPDGLDGSHGMAAPDSPLILRTTWSLRAL